MLTKKPAVKSKRSPKIIARTSKRKHWVDWQFHSHKKPFDSKMSHAQILEKRHAIESLLQNHLSNPDVWEDAGLVFTQVIFVPQWEIISTNPMVLRLTGDPADPTQPPGNGTVTPPPPHQPPPPNL